jgi:uncharacterized protein YjiK
MRPRLPAWLLGVLGGSLFLPVAVPGQAGTPLLTRCHYGAEPDTVRTLPAALREISGLAFHHGMLLAHDDEVGRIYSINPGTGAVAVFATLRGPITDDFEGIAVLGDTVWLMTSTGKLYGVKAAASTAPVPFVLRHTGLGKRCELEGLAADQAGGVLLLPCKTLAKYGKGVVVYRWSVAQGALASPASAGALPSALKGVGARSLKPSAIEVVPGSGNLLLLSASPPALLELDAAGTPRGYARLTPRHAQPEGLAIAPNGDLYISDEGANGPGLLSVYRCRP